MRGIILSLLLCSTTQVVAQEYWQQEVHYNIDVTLNDKEHSLKAFETFEYVNNSPHTLNQLYIHLWPNAYRNEKTALAKQLYKNKETLLTFGSDDVRGFIDSLDFTSGDIRLKWEYDPNNFDICIVHLPAPLKSGERIRISTPFYVKLPSGKISRLGHIDQSYQITQWYPKPAVYDKNGWHHMPYLNQGEFYSEYGSFDVSITLPSNYVVGSTGDVQTASELQFLDSLSQATRATIVSGSKTSSMKASNAFPQSSATTKTIRYVQNDVHDFAWFADKRYKVLKSTVKLPHSGREVTSWAMFTPKNEGLWSKADTYINDALYYYSLWNGDYPYQQATAVDGTISAGGGMEYPNVTVIGNSGSAQMLEVVIVHEVGHNWFYGQLGTNERVHGWMDEGLNTLNEVRYMQTKYPDNKAFSDMVLGGKFHFNDLNHHDLSDISYRMIAILGEDQPIETHSACFSSANYGVVMYQKTGLVFFYLKDYLGEELFDQCMRNYYDEWEFKHPQPEDLRLSIEKTSGKDLAWFFDDLIQTTKHIDYKIKSVKKTDEGLSVQVKNKGQVNGPIELNAFKGTELIETKWIEPGDKKRELILSRTDADKVQIDSDKSIPELYRQNNTWSKKGMLDKYEPLKLEFLIGDNEKDYSNAFWTPMIAGNYYDKFMLGVTLHNYGIPFQRFSYQITPLYSFGRQMVSGLADFTYTSRPATGMKISKFGLSLRSFKHDTTYRYNKSFYAAVLPYWTAKLGSRDRNSPFSNEIRVQGMYRYDQFGPQHIDLGGAYLSYQFAYTQTDHKIKVNLRNDYVNNLNDDDQLARVMLEANYSWRYMRNKQKRWIELRVFGGQQYIRDFDKTTHGYQYGMSLSGTGGSQDLFLDEFYFGRNNFSGIWAQQRQENMGGFKSTAFYGTTTIGMAAANLYIQLPIPGGLFGIFADAGVFHNGVRVEDAAQVGLAIRASDFFGVYFPIWMSKELNDSYGNSSYGEKIRFTLKMNLFNKGLNLSSFL